MEDENLPKDFWRDKVSKSISKDDLPPEIWEKICKYRNSPIMLTRDHIIGDQNKPHMVLPKGLKGYLIDYPDVFFTSEDEREIVQPQEDFDFMPAIFKGCGDIIYLTDDYEIIEPFFDMDLADYAEQFKIEK